MPSLLNRCARLQLHGEQQHELKVACGAFRQWEELLLQAEEQGMAPLLHKHLVGSGAEVPVDFLRGLRFLCLRHQRANATRLESLRQVLGLLEREGFPSLVLKGAALCQTLYPEVGLRPMRDIDLLLDARDVHHVHELLQQYGFRVAKGRLPEHYYHLAPLIKDVDGMEVCLELHRGLFPREPPYYHSPSFGEFYERAQSFSMAGSTAFCLSDEDMLWHLFQHGFRAPLTYEAHKLISVADIIGLVEARVEDLDWHRIASQYPQLLRSLPLFHYLSPWQSAVLKKIPALPKVAPSKVGQSYGGWPCKAKVNGVSDRDLWPLLYETACPGHWWLMLYYSTGTGWKAMLYCRLLRHPLHILRWVKVRCRFSLRSFMEQGRGLREHFKGSSDGG